MFCHKCGAKAVEGQTFCMACGTRLLSAEGMGGTGVRNDGPGRTTAAPNAWQSPIQGGTPAAAAQAAPSFHDVLAALSAQTKGVIIAVAAAVMVVALVLGIVVTSSRGVLYRAATACGTETSDYDEYVDQGQTVYSSGSRVMILSDDHQSLAIMSDDIPDCVFDNIGMPDEIMTRFNDTSSSDGMMSDSFDRFDISWYYDGSRLYTVLTRKGLL